MGPGLSFGDRRAAHGAHHTADPRAHQSGREPPALAVWRRVRYVPRPDLTAASRALLAPLLWAGLDADSAAGIFRPGQRLVHSGHQAEPAPRLVRPGHGPAC